MPENKIRGRIVVKESGIGIPDLIVVIHDVDPVTPADGHGADAPREEARPDEVDPDIELREITDANREAVLAVSVAPGQKRFVGSVAGALEDAVECSPQQALVSRRVRGRRAGRVRHAQLGC